MMIGQDLRERRGARVREHMESENPHDFEVTLGTFDHPRYEIVPTREVFDLKGTHRGPLRDAHVLLIERSTGRSARVRGPRWPPATRPASASRRLDARLWPGSSGSRARPARTPGETARRPSVSAEALSLIHISEPTRPY